MQQKEFSKEKSPYIGNISIFTYYEERFDDDIADHWRSVRTDETRIVRDDDGDVESGDEYQPVPTSFENAVMR